MRQNLFLTGGQALPVFDTLEERLLLAVSAEEQLFVYLLNRARHDPQAYQIEANLSVSLAGIAPQPPLAVNNALFSSSEFHAAEMASHNYFAHQSAVTGDWPNKMARDAGYALPSFYADGANNIESLAAGYSTPAAALKGLIEDIGVNPPGHRYHLLATTAFFQTHREIGIGYGYNASSTYDYYWAIHTGCRDGFQTFLTGVVFNDADGDNRYDAGEGLPGVTVTLGGTSVQTNAAGGYSVSALPGTYTVSVSGGSFVGSASASVTFSDQNIEADFLSGQSAGWVNFTAPSGTTRDIAVEYNSTVIADGDTSPATSDGTDFGAASVSGATVARTFTIRNTGQAVLTLSGSPRVSIGGTHAADFTVSAQPSAGTLDGGGSTTFTITFDPSGTGVRTATVTIASDDPDENPYTFTIQGTGQTVTAPEIDIRGNGASIANNDASPSLSDHTDFSVVAVSGGTLDRTFTIANSGSGTLTLSGSPRVSIGGSHAADFTVTAQPSTGTLAGGASTTFTIRFDASAAGLRSASVTVLSNDGDEPSYTFAIQGTGQAASMPEIDVRGNDTSIANGDASPSGSDHTDFGLVVASGGTIDRTFTIANTGSAPLTLSGSPRVSIGGSHASDFTVTAQPSTGTLAGGASTTFTIRFDPSAVGSRTATVTILSNDGDEGTYTFAIGGMGDLAGAPEIGLIGNGKGIASGDTSPSTADNTDFGATVPGSAITRSFTIRNTGQGTLWLTDSPPVQIGGANPAGFSVTVQPGGSVGPSVDSVFTIRFVSAALGVQTATVTVRSNDSDEGVYTFTVQAGVYGELVPDMEVRGYGLVIASGDSAASSGDGTNFGPLNLGGQTVTRTFFIHNLGQADLTLSGSPRVEIFGAAASDYSVVSQPEATVAPGGQTSFQVRFAPSAAGARPASVRIANSDPDESPYTFALLGDGVATAEIDVTGLGGAGIADGDAAPSEADGTDFGLAMVDGQTVIRTFTIRNLGLLDLSLGGAGVTLDGAHASDFSLVSLPSLTVAPGGETTFQVRFDPSATGRRQAALHIASNDVDEGSYDIALQGTGVVAPQMQVEANGRVIAPQDDTPSTLDNTDFGTLEVAGQSTTRTFIIRNAGMAELLLTGSPRVTLEGPAAGDFSIVTLPGGSVAPGGTTTFTIRFDPSAGGLRSATVRIQSNDAAQSPYTFAIAGNGLAWPEIEILGNAAVIAHGDTTPSLADLTDFGTVALGGNVVRIFNIRNSGTADLVLSGSPRVAISGAHAGDFTVTSLPPQSLAAGSTSFFQVQFTPSATGLRQATITVASNDSDQSAYQFAIQGGAPVVNPGTSLEADIGTGRPGILYFTDGDGTKVTVQLIGATARVVLSGTGLSQTTPAGNWQTTVTGANVKIADIQLQSGGATAMLMISGYGGNGRIDVGKISGGASLGTLYGLTTDLTGEGIVLTGAGRIQTIYLGNILAGADIVTPGTGTVPVTVLAGRVEGETTMTFGSPVGLLSLNSWTGSGTLTAPRVGTAMVYNDFRANLTLNGTADAAGNTLSMLYVMGNVTGSQVRTGVGGAQAIYAGSWAGGLIDTQYLGALVTTRGGFSANIDVHGQRYGQALPLLSVAGALSSPTIDLHGKAAGTIYAASWPTGQFSAGTAATIYSLGALGADLTLSDQNAWGQSLGVLYALGAVTSNTFALTHGAGTIYAGSWNVANASARFVTTLMSLGGFAGNLTLTGQNLYNQSLGMLYVIGAMQNAEVRAPASVGTVMAGSMNGCKLYVGLAGTPASLPTQAGHFSSATASLGMLYVTGAFANSTVAAPSVGTVIVPSLPAGTWLATRKQQAPKSAVSVLMARNASPGYWFGMNDDVPAAGLDVI